MKTKKLVILLTLSLLFFQPFVIKPAICYAQEAKDNPKETPQQAAQREEGEGSIRSEKAASAVSEEAPTTAPEAPPAAPGEGDLSRGPGGDEPAQFADTTNQGDTETRINNIVNNLRNQLEEPDASVLKRAADSAVKASFPELANRIMPGMSAAQRSISQSIQDRFRQP